MRRVKQLEVISGEIKRVRDRLGMTQEEFATTLQVAHSSVQNWESGRTKPHRGMLARIRALAPRAEAERAKGKKSRIAEETRHQLLTALDTILERAPSAVIEEISRILTDRAGKYGEPR